jgi:phosphoglucosamine mutase
MPRYPQVTENIRVAERRLTPEIVDEVDRSNAALGNGGRILVRPSGTEPVIRVLAEAETAQEAETLCARIAALVRRELG